MTQRRNYKTVAIPIDVHAQLRHYGFDHNLSVVAILTEAISEWLSRRNLGLLSGGVGSAEGSGLEAGSEKRVEIGLDSLNRGIDEQLARDHSVGPTSVGTVGGRPMSSTLPVDEGRESDESGETF